MTNKKPMRNASHKPPPGQHRMVLNARRIVTTPGNTELIRLAIEPLDNP
jgi:hypothetical protein